MSKILADTSGNFQLPEGDVGAGGFPSGSSVGISRSSCCSILAHMASAMSGTGRFCNFSERINSYGVGVFNVYSDVPMLFVRISGLR